MQEIKNIFSMVFHIDHMDGNAKSIKLSDETEVEDWIVHLSEKSLSESRKREYKFDGNGKETKTLIENIIGRTGKPEIHAQKLAERLLNAETEAQKRMNHLHGVRQGSMALTYFAKADQKYLIIAKVDHEAFLDDKSLHRRQGIPYKMNIYKICLLFINGDNSIHSIELSDNASSVAKYWSADFLEMAEVRSDAQNTSFAVAKINKILMQHVNETSPLDFVYLKNKVFNFFESRENFNLDEFLSDTIENYEFKDPKINANLVTQKIQQLTVKNEIDSTFRIERQKLDRYIKTTVPIIADRMELNFIRSIINLESIVKAEMINNKKCIVIETDEGYDYFRH